MKILFVKSIFCPSNDFYVTTITSLLKSNIFINKFLKDNSHIFDLRLIGWAGIYEQKIINLLDNFFPHNSNYKNISHELWSINYGKYKILNSIIEYLQNKNYDILLYMDHDIYFDMTTMQYFDNIIELANDAFMSSYPDSVIDSMVPDSNVISDSINYNFGLIAFNQKKDCRHQNDIYENIKIVNNLEVVWPTHNTSGSIASGAFIVSAKKIEKIPNFNLIAVYGLDDYYLSKQFECMGYLNIVTKNFYVVHPFNNCTKYDYWKQQNVLKLINGTSIDYYQNIEESMSIDYASSPFNYN